MNITHVRPRFGPPVVVTLDYADAKEVTSQLHGNLEYMYTCNDGGVKFYAPAECYEQIAKLNPQAGSTIAVRKVKKGLKNSFEAALVSDAEEPEPEPEGTRVPANIEPPPLPVKPLRYAAGSSKAAFPPSKYAQGVPQTEYSNANGNGHGHAPTHMSGVSPTAQHLRECFHIAIDVLKEAQQYGRDMDFSATFLGSDVKSLALSIYINDQQGGGKR